MKIQLIASAALMLLSAVPVSCQRSQTTLHNGATMTAEDSLDLSKELKESPTINKSPGALAVLEAAEADPDIRTAIVIEDGQIVASYVRDGVDQDEPVYINSVTKSITSLLYGILIDEGYLDSVHVTLGEIFTDESDWEGVPDVEFRKVRQRGICF